MDFGNSETRRHGAAAEGLLRCLGEPAAYLIGPSGGRPVAAIGAQQDEFLSSVAGHQIAGSAGRFQQVGQAFDHFVAGLMAVGVVDALEEIEVADDQAARNLLLPVGLDEELKYAVELGAIGDLRERIPRRLGVQALAALLERDFRGCVVENKDGAENRPMGIGNGDRVAID